MQALGFMTDTYSQRGLEDAFLKDTCEDLREERQRLLQGEEQRREKGI